MTPANLARDSAIYGAAAILARLVAVVLVPIYGHFMRPAELGAYDVVLALASCAGFAIALEMAQAAGRFVVEAKTEAERKAYASSALGFVLVAYSVFLALCVLASPSLARWLTGSESDAHVVWLAAAVVVSYGLNMHAQNQARYQNQASAFALSNIALAAGTTLGAVVFVWRLRWGLAGALASLLLGTASAMLVVLALLKPRLSAALDWPRARRMLAYSLPLVPAGAAAIALQIGDRFVIKEVLTLHELGLYGAASRFASIVSVCVGAIQAPLLPFLLSGAMQPDTPQRLERTTRYFLALAAFCIVGLAVFANELMRWFTAPEYASAARLIPLVALALAIGGCQLFAPGLLIARRTARYSAIVVSAVAINLVLDVLLLPHTGILGAPLIAAFAASLLVTALIQAGQPLFRVAYRWKRYGAIALVALIAAGCGLLLNAWSTGPGALLGKFALLALCAGVLYAVCAEREERRALKTLVTGWRTPAALFSARRKAARRPR